SNYAGVLEPAFQIPATGLSLRAGANVGPVPGINYSPFAVQANRVKNGIGTWGVAGAVNTTDGRLVSWTGSNPFTYLVRMGNNPLDGLGIAYLAGPRLTPSGGGSGAVFVPVVNGGQPGPGPITAIVVASGGTGYPNSGTITIDGPGAGATATYTA